MNSRERVFTAINHREPDRIPYIGLLYQQLVDGLNAELPVGSDYRDYYGEDIRLVGVSFPEHSSINLKENFFPLPSAEAVETARRDCATVKERGLIACNTYMMGIFEHFKTFVGDEAALADMLLEREQTRQHLTHITDWLCRLYEIYADIGFDICFNGDDIGTQKSTIFSMDCYREFYKPNHRRLVEAVKSINPGTYMAFHCCGYMHTIIPEWIDIGVDIVHSVQPEANDLMYLKNTFGDKMVFWGALGLQSEMYYQTLEEMEMTLRNCLRIMAVNGGFIAATSNYVTGEVPPEKIKLMYHVLREYGRYPII